ncbi:hypothetical protein Scep_010119 [Stephania cephalantha]|uniref:Uncharacterized protein n=1 Tax=Stephania cephalantha TaxID=152367 RepID=A0AAP0PD26_9MAGN
MRETIGSGDRTSGSAAVQWERGWWLLQCTGASDGAKDAGEEDDRAEGQRGGRDALQQRDSRQWRRMRLQTAARGRGDATGGGRAAGSGGDRAGQRLRSRMAAAAALRGGGPGRQRSAATGRPADARTAPAAMRLRRGTVATATR